MSSGARMRRRSSAQRQDETRCLEHCCSHSTASRFWRVGVLGVRQRADEAEARRTLSIEIGYDRSDGEERPEGGEIVAHIHISCA
jgi:hypothetical protein